MPNPGVDIGGKLAENEVTRLLAIAKEIGIKEEDFAEMVERLKKEEASAINRAGLKRQFEYIFQTYGPAVEFVKKARKRILDQMKDYAPPGKLVECGLCGETEFRSRAKRHGERWACEECAKLHEEATEKALKRANS